MRYLEQIYRDRENTGYQGLEGGENEELFNGYKFSVWNDKMYWRRIMVIVAQHCEFA